MFILCVLKSVLAVKLEFMYKTLKAIQVYFNSVLDTVEINSVLVFLYCFKQYLH